MTKIEKQKEFVPKTLDELTKFIEQNASRPDRIPDFSRYFKELAKKASSKEKQILQWEIDFLEFFLHEGKSKPMHSITKEDGSVWGYPSYENFDEDTFKYLQLKAQNARNPILKARYNQILWNSTFGLKNQSQAKAAIDAYIELLENIPINDDLNPNRDFLELFKNGCALSQQIDYRFNSFLKIARTVLFDKPELEFVYKQLLLDYMVGVKKFKKQDFDGSLALLDNILDELIESKSFSGLDEVAKVAVKIANRTSGNNTYWNSRLGQCYELMGKNRLDDKSRLIPLHWLQLSLQAYNSAKNKKKVEEISLLYNSLKKELKLNEISVPFEYEEKFSKYDQERTEKVLNLSTEQIWTYLANGKDIVPNRKWLTNISKSKGQSFLDHVTTIKFDINKNISNSSIKGDYGKEKEKLMESLHLYMKLFGLPYLNQLFTEGIRREKITFHSLSKFLIENSWLSQTLQETDSTGRQYEYKWLSLIYPSLLEFFMQIESDIKSPSPFANYILCTDSLTLKFEGVLRDFARILGIQTSTIDKKGNIREMYPEEILSNSKVQKYFNEQDLLLFDYIFNSKNGINLRNNVAHCFYRFKDYNLAFMYLLIIVFLRIGRYRLEIPKKIIDLKSVQTLT